MGTANAIHFATLALQNMPCISRVLKNPVHRPAIAKSMAQGAKRKKQRDNGLMTAGQSIHDLQTSILTAQHSVLFTDLLIADG